jgi:hypothetical protein
MYRSLLALLMRVLDLLPLPYSLLVLSMQTLHIGELLLAVIVGTAFTVTFTVTASD